jgi:hypothetical protein
MGHQKLAVCTLIPKINSTYCNGKTSWKEYHEVQMLPSNSKTKVIKLVKEVKHLAILITAEHDLHDIHTTLSLITQRPHLQDQTQQDAIH